jgi:hypothetical protein
MNLRPHDYTTSRLCFSCVAIVSYFLVSFQAIGEELTDEEKDAGFVSMFNGVDFDGWRFTGKDSDKAPDNWSVEDGVIKVSGGGKPHLGTAREYADFEMRFQWRAMREKYNSGFFIRSPINLGKNQLNLAKGGEGNFIGGKLKGAKGVPDLQKKSGEWNDWRVLAVGEDVTFWCNGELAWKGTGLQPASGHIGLQAEGAPLEFRSLRIREIK